MLALTFDTQSWVKYIWKGTANDRSFVSKYRSMFTSTSTSPYNASFHGITNRQRS